MNVYFLYQQFQFSIGTQLLNYIKTKTCKQISVRQLNSYYMQNTSTLAKYSLDSNHLYQSFFVHYFVNPLKHKFTYLEDKFKSFRQPTLDHPKKTIELGYMKKYSNIVQIMPFSTNTKIQKKLQVSKIEQIIKSVFNAYQYYFLNGGCNRIIFNKHNHQSYMQQFLLLRLCQIYPQMKAGNYGSLDKFILSFFFTLNYIKSCNLQIKGFVALLTFEDNIIQVFLNFILRNKCNQSSQFETTIKIDFVQKIIKIIQDQSSNKESSSLISQFSTIKQECHNDSIEDNMTEIRTVIALDIISNFLRANSHNRKFRLSQVKIYKLLRVCQLIPKKQQKQQLNWEQVLNFCFSKLSTQNCQQQKPNINEFQNSSYDRLLLLALTQKNYIISKKVQASNPHMIQKYRQESFQFLFSYVDELLDARSSKDHQLYELYIRLKGIYNYGILVIKPLLIKILKKSELNELFKKYSSQQFRQIEAQNEAILNQ